jgi:hypothetical protein
MTEIKGLESHMAMMRTVRSELLKEASPVSWPGNSTGDVSGHAAAAVSAMFRCLTKERYDLLCRIDFKQIWVAQEAQTCNAKAQMEDVHHVARSVRYASFVRILTF